jgi:hypothetical protein
VAAVNDGPYLQITYRETVTYTTPPGWMLKSRPKDVAIDRGPAEYAARYRRSENRVTVERLFVLRTASGSCPAAMADEMAPVFKAAAQDVEARDLHADRRSFGKGAAVPGTEPPDGGGSRTVSLFEVNENGVLRAGARLVDCTLTSEVLIGN